MRQYTLLTKSGLAKLILAGANKSSIKLTHIAIGDGAGELSEESESLNNEVLRIPINAITISEEDESILEVEGVINADVGGFYIKEAGVIAEDGSLFAVAKVAESYKPLLSEGSSKDITICFKIQIQNAQAISLKVDNASVLATRKWVLASNYTKEQIDEKLKGIDSYPVGAYILWSSEAKTPAGFLKADGRSLRKSEYEELFSVLGYTYGGSGESFNIPNFSDGKFIRSIGGNALSLGEAQGEGIDTSSLLIKSYLPDSSGGGRYEYGADGTTTAGTRGVTFIYSNSQESDIDYRGKFKKDDTYIFSSTKKANETRPYNSSVVVLIKVKNVKEATSLPDTTIYATEAKAGLVKIKNSINGNAEDMAVTEKAVNVELAGLKGQILGLEQTWQDVRAERRVNVTYTNSTQKPIVISLAINTTTYLYINEVKTAKIYYSGNFVIPAGASYKIDGGNIEIWSELR